MGNRYHQIFKGLTENTKLGFFYVIPKTKLKGIPGLNMEEEFLKECLKNRHFGLLPKGGKIFISKGIQ
jgi:hypothetical protein